MEPEVESIRVRRLSSYNTCVELCKSLDIDEDDVRLRAMDYISKIEDLQLRAEGDQPDRVWSATAVFLALYQQEETSQTTHQVMLGEDTCIGDRG
ncbi:unnamed protein product, partial [Choristocarpus tenellus]